MTNTSSFCIKGHFVDTPVLGKIRLRTNHLLVIDNGKIKDIIDLADKSKLLPHGYEDAIDYTTNPNTNQIQFIFPGFVDTHCHAPQYPNIGIFGNTTLLDWLNKYTFPLEHELATNLQKAEFVYKNVIRKTLNNGTTTIAYYATIGKESTQLLADLCLKMGQRAFVGKVCMDMNAPNYYSESHHSCIEDNTQLITTIRDANKKYSKERFVEPIITPRFAPMVSQKTMKSLSELSKKHDVPIQTHLSETFNEIDLVMKTFPECDNYTDVYNRYGLLTDKTVLAHCIHLSEEEASVIQKKNAGVSHCPVSNSSITSGECKVRWLLEKGIKVSLGTDMSGGYSPSILKTARQGLLVSRHVAMKTSDEVGDRDKLSTNEVLYLATKGGAEVLNLENKIGTFEVGKSFDAQLIKLGDETNVDVFEWQVPLENTDNEEDFMDKWQDIIDKWVFLGDDRESKHVWVDGVKVK